MTKQGSKTVSNILSKVQVTGAMPLSHPMPYCLKTEEKEQNLHTMVHFGARIQIKANNKNLLVIFLSLNKTITILAEYYHQVHSSP